MYRIAIARTSGCSVRPSRSTICRLYTAAATVNIAEQHTHNDASKINVAGTSVHSTAVRTPPRSHSHGQPGVSATIKSVRRQLEASVNSSAFYHAVYQIVKIREQYVQDRSVFVRGEDMMPILSGLGASHEDLMRLPSTSEGLETDPTLPFRKTVNSRFCFDWDTESLRRMEHQPFMLYAGEDFQRFDSGKIRTFDDVKEDLGLNSAFLALLIFKAMMINGIDVARRSNLNYDVNKWVCTAFSIRTITTPELLGEPALEGVHSDGVDHTLVTFLGSKNMASNSAATFLHSMDETTGIPLRESSPLNIVGHNRHTAFLDTMMIVDHERKHSLDAVYAEDKTENATRDVLIFFTRRPYLQTHPAASLDSFAPHATLGVEVPLLDIS